MKGRGETSENITRTLQGTSFENGNKKVNKQHISVRRVNEEKITTYIERGSAELSAPQQGPATPDTGPFGGL